MVAPPIFTEVIGDKLSNSYSQDLYTSFKMNLAADPVNIPTPLFVDLGLLKINSIDKGASICTPATKIQRTMNVAHGIVIDHIFVKTTAVRDNVRENSDYNYKLVLKFGGKIRNFSAKRMQVVDHLLN